MKIKEEEFCKRCSTPYLVNKKKGIYCKHFEDLLPKQQKREVGTVKMGGRVDEIADVMRARRIPEDELLKQLRAFGLGEYEIELLMLRYVEGKSMKEIVKEQGWQNVNSANYFMRKALKLLKQAGFVFK